MDGFHLSNQVLNHLNRRHRKGAPDTFDAHGFIHLLRRLHRPVEDVAYAPEFDRDLDEPVAGAIAIRRSESIVIVEGNYLLLDEHPWLDLERRHWLSPAHRCG
jgi:pantothenate kinase